MLAVNKSVLQAGSVQRLKGAAHQRVGGPARDCYLPVLSLDPKRLTWIVAPIMLGACECKE